MVDKLRSMERSKLMAKVSQKNTLPEIQVRKLLHSMGYRFRLHRKDIVGCPDIYLPRYRVCLFVNGCFWHQHPGCLRASIPKSNAIFWRNKFQKNLDRDKYVQKTLENEGFHVVVIWECQTKSFEKLQKTVKEIAEKFLLNSISS